MSYWIIGCPIQRINEQVQFPMKQRGPRWRHLPASSGVRQFGLDSGSTTCELGDLPLVTSPLRASAFSFLISKIEILTITILLGLLKGWKEIQQVKPSTDWGADSYLIFPFSCSVYRSLAGEAHADWQAFVSYRLRYVSLILCLERKPLRTEVMFWISWIPLICFELVGKHPLAMWWRGTGSEPWVLIPAVFPNPLWDLRPIPSLLWTSVVPSTTQGICSRPLPTEAGCS